MSEIPEAFLNQMQSLLGEEYPAFLASLERPPEIGLRANTLKIPSDELRKRLPYFLESTPWCGAGFRLLEKSSQEGVPPPSRHPYYAAGLYYLQEPSAMAVAELHNPQPGERVLDLCAAPGGKTTHLACLMQQKGLLVANEIHPQRVWELAENLERWGVQNAIITHESPAHLAEHFGAFFDRVLVDAPCSGEGMFRKSETARQEWSPGLVSRCAVRQFAILAQAARLVRPGGLLAYATCTFNPHENERVISRFVREHPEFEIEEIPPLPFASPGRPNWVEKPDGQPALQYTVRIWPHLSPGEGHFIALLRRRHAPSVSSPHIKGEKRTTKQRSYLGRALQAAPIAAIQVFEHFCRSYLSTPQFLEAPIKERLKFVGSYLYLLPEGCPELEGLRIVHPGWWLGALKMNSRGKEVRFEPAHALAMGLSASQARLKLDLSWRDPELIAYLRGEILPTQGEEGWVLVTVDGFPLGWGKRLQGKLKNYYPRGLRWY